MEFPFREVSSSMVTSYLDCPLGWKLHYIDRVKQESTALDTGTMFDLMFKEKVKGRDPFKRVKAELMSTPPTKEQVKAFKLCREMLENYRPELDSADYQNCRTDVEFKVALVNFETGEVLPQRARGFLDFETEEIEELKTTTEDYTQEKVDSSFQATMYAYYKYMHDRMERKFRDVYRVNYKVFSKKTKQPQYLTTQRTTQDFVQMVETIEWFTGQVEAENFNRNINHPYYCLCRKHSH